MGYPIGADHRLFLSVVSWSDRHSRIGDGLLLPPPIHHNFRRDRMRFSSPGQTSSHLTEKRILQPAPHGKAHSAQASHQKAHSGLIDSRKAAFCDSQIAQTAPFRHIAARGARGATPPPACGALWRMPQLGKRARATPRQPAGGGCARARKPRPGAWPHGKAQSGQRASLMARPGPGRDTIRLPVVG